MEGRSPSYVGAYNTVGTWLSQLRSGGRKSNCGRPIWRVRSAGS